MSKKKPKARVRIRRILLLLAIALGILAAGAAYLVRGPLVAGVEERPVSAAISEERMRETVDLLCNRLFPRNYRNPAILDQAAKAPRLAVNMASSAGARCSSIARTFTPFRSSAAGTGKSFMSRTRLR